MRIASLEVRRYAVDARPAVPRRLGPGAAAGAVEASLVIVRADDGTAGYASGDDLPDAALLERLLVGLDPRRTEVVRELCETVDLHGGRPWMRGGRRLGPGGAAWRASRCGGCSAGATSGILAYASSGELVAPEERARRVLALQAAGVRAVKLRFHHADWRDDVAVVEAVRDAVGGSMEIMVDANHGWRMPGDRARPLGRARRRSRARGRWSRSGSTGSRSRCPPATWRATRALRAATSLRLAAGEMVRSLAEARDLVLRGGVDVVQPDVVLARRDRRRAADRGAGRPLRAHVVAAHVVQRPGAAGQPAPRARRLDVPVPGGAARPAGLVAGAARLAAGRRRRAGDRAGRDGRRARRARTGRRRPTSTRWRRTASHEDPGRRPARVLHAAVRRGGRARAAARRRGARPRRRGRRLPLRPPPRRRPPRARAGADGARPRGRRRRRGRGGGRRRTRAGRPRRVLLRAVVRGAAARALPGGATSARWRASWRGRGCCSTARAGCGSPTAGPRSTSTSSPASRSGPSCPRRARCRSRGRCRCGRRRCSAAAW